MSRNFVFSETTELGCVWSVDLVDKSGVCERAVGVVFRENIGEISVDFGLEVECKAADDSVDDHSESDFSEGGEFVEFGDERVQNEGEEWSHENDGRMRVK